MTPIVQGDGIIARTFSKSFYRSKVWQDMRKYMLDKVNYKCQECGQVGKLEVHHTITLNEQNINDPAIALNDQLLRVLCTDCHFKQHHNKREDVNEGYEFINGYIVPVKSQ